MYTVTHDVTRRLCTAWLGEDGVDTEEETVTRDHTCPPWKVFGGGGGGVCVCVCVHSTTLHGTVVDVANPCTTY